MARASAFVLSRAAPQSAWLSGKCVCAAATAGLEHAAKLRTTIACRSSAYAFCLIASVAEDAATTAGALEEPPGAQVGHPNPGQIGRRCSEGPTMA
jgi:hypothetical protein